uniref:Uncharacterized protein YuzE n=1 Tax=Candidatus Kentrum sp. MB TaxID=2138164 RepID=A0A451BG93_9GAMM|nr:MAG: Uncharacterized protein YuzE [Candidatus Kentron sp. MB]VFK35503.1 MAG: Uncharacterized protein YuzE [Candidatus Kentron sp. MB]VFK77315.1 MAG: Uncharacterized protein YuzE [Candidatus Kentron sp. MB]
MASVNFALQDYMNLIPMVMQSSQHYLWSSYDAEADVLYVNCKKPSHATDSELLDNDVIVRYENEQIIGITILHAKDRLKDLDRME